MIKINRMALKWVALITMFIDHIGAIIGQAVFESWGLVWLYFVLRVIGRISFPIFAFFIAEGWRHTHSKARYALTLLAFAIITQPIYYFALNDNLFDLNILFTFCISLLVLQLIDQIKKDKGLTPFYVVLIIAILLLVFVLDGLGITVSYGIYGVLFTATFYIFYNADFKHHRVWLWCVASLLMILDWLSYFIMADMTNFGSYLSLFALLALPPLMLYNGEKGKHSLKWLFYIFYPAHILIIYLFTLLI